MKQNGDHFLVLGWYMGLMSTEYGIYSICIIIFYEFGGDFLWRQQFLELLPFDLLVSVAEFQHNAILLFRLAASNFWIFPLNVILTA